MYRDRTSAQFLFTVRSSCPISSGREHSPSHSVRCVPAEVCQKRSRTLSVGCNIHTHGKSFWQAQQRSLALEMRQMRHHEGGWHFRCDYSCHSFTYGVFWIACIMRKFVAAAGRSLLAVENPEILQRCRESKDAACDPMRAFRRVQVQVLESTD